MKKIYSVSNMHCSACKANVENALKGQKGIKECDANLITNSVCITYNDKDISEDEIIKIEKSAGYNLTLIEGDEIYLTRDNFKLKVLKIILGVLLTIPLMYFAMAGMGGIENVPSWLINPIYLSGILQIILATIIIALYFSYYKVGFLALIKLRPNMESLVFLGSLFSYVYSLYLLIMVGLGKVTHAEHAYPHYFFDSSSMILVIVYIGKFIESLSKRKANSTIEGLLKLRPKSAKVLRNNEVVEIESKYLKVGDIVLVNPGETIPADGTIIKGKTSIDESLLTGESNYVLKEEDDFVIGGSINKEGSIQFIVDKLKNDSTLEKIISLVSEASNMKTNLTKKVDTVSLYFVPTIMGISLITFIIWLLLGLFYYNYSGFNSFDLAFGYFANVLVVACPCALGLATPISLLVGSSIFAKNGILVNKSDAIETLKSIDCLVMDKTNTITKGEFEVVDILYLNDLENLNSLIYTIETYSSHPLAVGISNYFKNETLLKDVTSADLIPGMGVFSKYKDTNIYAGNRKYLDSILKENSSLVDKYIKEEYQTIYIFDDNKVYAIIYLQDKLKEESKDFVFEAKKIFKRIILLTGDNLNIAKKIAEESNIDEVIAEVTPIDKDNKIKELQNEGYKVMMIGDGVNDSIALSRSDVGVGIAKGSDIALSSSDFILMNNNLMDIISILKISKRIRNNISFNLLWAFLYNIAFIPVAAGVFSYFNFILNPMICSLLMALSSVTVCLNALTLFIKSINKRKK